MPAEVASQSFRIVLAGEDDFEGWRDAARGLAEAGVPATAIGWHVAGAADLFGADPDSIAPPSGPGFAVPRGGIMVTKMSFSFRCREKGPKFRMASPMIQMR